MKAKIPYFGGDKRKVITGKEKGKDYAEVSKEVENTFTQWIAFSGLSTEEFDSRMNASTHIIDECINADGDIEIHIFAGGEDVIAPLVFRMDGEGTIDDFIINSLFLLSYVAARYENKSFEKAVAFFADRMIEERKMTL